MSTLRFDGQVAVVTGAGRGMGRCHALLLASRGAKVVVADFGVDLDGSGSSQEPATEVVRDIEAAGGEAVACFASVATEQGANSIVESALEAFGRLDVLINNAGISNPELFEDQTTDQFRTMVDVQYLGTVYVTKAAWPHFMKAGYGRIVNTVSEGPLGIHEKMTSYGGAKGGVIGFTLALAAEGRKYGVSVNGFSPRIATRLSAPEVLAKVYDLPKEHFAESMKRFPPELASPAAVFLAHESCPLNGVILVSGGGQVLRMAIMQNEGATSEEISPEFIAQNISQVIDMSDARNIGVGAGGEATLPEVKLQDRAES
jgi:NAD(P)-dependent dehydrogenase (short-subunit alcohol dehydrogenase family)